jgi:3-oxoadipate enol-lactonase
MTKVELGDVSLNYTEDGDPNGQPVVFAHALGTSLALWDEVVSRLPKNLRLIRYDIRGHGHSDCPAPPYSMGALIRDAERLLDFLKVRDCVFVGISIGGMIAQGLAIKRLDQIRALVLVNTAAKIGHAPHWDALIDRVQQNGISDLCETTMQGWFTKDWLTSNRVTPWREQFETTPQDAILGALHAVKGTDFYTPTSGLRLPTLGIAGSEDRTIPPDLTRETVDLIPGSAFRIIRRSGHLPCVDQPTAFATHLTEFLDATGHI